MTPKTVLVVDDSALMRKLLTSIINSADDLEVVGAAPDPFVAREMIKRLNPDVVTLDVEMPRMDGLAFLGKIMSLRPMPVVMISSLTQEAADVTLQALELGAVDIVAKPTSDLAQTLSGMDNEIITKVRAAAGAIVRRIDPGSVKYKAPVISTTDQLIAIGASTGGVAAIGQVLAELPANAPAIAIVQHMPKEFTGNFARRLDQKLPLKVVEATDNQRLLPGHVVIAPGDKHLEVQRSGGEFRCKLTDGPKVSGHRPSVDVLFQSVAQQVHDRAIGVILTGMGRDGAEGLLKMREAGAVTIGQDEATSTVYGMCGTAFNIGAVQHQLPLPEIAKGILSEVRMPQKQTGASTRDRAPGRRDPARP